jgi:serine/threonine-protein kinase haspin
VIFVQNYSGIIKDSRVPDEPDHSAPSYSIQPLVDAYFTDRGITISPNSWDSVLPSHSTLQKIAEASFAEVYRVINADGTSILKIMQLKVSTDPGSLDIRTACAVESVISELRIMNALTEIPGFVTFKEAHIIRGKPGPQIKQAWNAHFALSGDKSEFPHPEDYTSDSTFLVIELGDAGNVLEDYKMEHIEQLWDVLLGAIIALSRAEFTNDFEVCSHLYLYAYLQFSFSHFHSIEISTKTTSASSRG